MIYIKKQEVPPVVFTQAIQGLNNYDELRPPNRDTVTDLLLKEQGGLCAICERKYKSEEGKIHFGATIEHFLPKSIFPNKQLHYHNLYVACAACNGPKGSHLIPAYIFDSRFSPNFPFNAGTKPIYTLKDGKCYVEVMNMDKNTYTTPEHHNAHLLQVTLDLLQQNRYSETSKYPETSSLTFQRAVVFKAIMARLKSLPEAEIRRKFENIQRNTTLIHDGVTSEPPYPEYPEFISLIAYLFYIRLGGRTT